MATHKKAAQPVDFGCAINPVARTYDPVRLEQTLLVVSAQGAGGNARKACQLFDGVFHGAFPS